MRKFPRAVHRRKGHGHDERGTATFQGLGLSPHYPRLHVPGVYQSDPRSLFPTLDPLFLFRSRLLALEIHADTLKDTVIRTNEPGTFARVTGFLQVSVHTDAEHDVDCCVCSLSACFSIDFPLISRRDVKNGNTILDLENAF